MSPKTEAQVKAEKKYHEKLSGIELQVQKGKKEEFKAKADANGMSLPKFIKHLVEEDSKKG